MEDISPETPLSDRASVPARITTSAPGSFIEMEDAVRRFKSSYLFHILCPLIGNKKALIA
jgi:hypothetical protein